MKLLPALLLACLLPAGALACACPEGEETPEQAFDNADLVFTGEVTGLQGGYFYYTLHATTFKPIHVFKGLSGTMEEIALATSDAEGSCDLTFWEKRQYLVYANLDKDGRLFHASICGRTTFLKGAEEEVAVLQKLERDEIRRMPQKIEGAPTMPVMPRE